MENLEKWNDNLLAGYQKVKVHASTQIEAISYNPKTQVLTVFFVSGKFVYQYHPIKPKDYEDMLAAESMGSWFWKNVRDNKDIKVTKYSTK